MSIRAGRPNAYPHPNQPYYSSVLRNQPLQIVCDVMVGNCGGENTVCGDIAYAIHEYQVKQGMQKYIFHRPGHGEASEGHYAPYIALGDRTVLKKNSIFSEEPGLYDPDTGVGYN